jgi:hypothetical protein
MSAAAPAPGPAAFAQPPFSAPRCPFAVCAAFLASPSGPPPSFTGVSDYVSVTDAAACSGLAASLDSAAHYAASCSVLGFLLEAALAEWTAGTAGTAAGPGALLDDAWISAARRYVERMDGRMHELAPRLIKSGGWPVEVGCAVPVMAAVVWFVRPGAGFTLRLSRALPGRYAALLVAAGARAADALEVCGAACGAIADPAFAPRLRDMALLRRVRAESGGKSEMCGLCAALAEYAPPTLERLELVWIQHGFGGPAEEGLEAPEPRLPRTLRSLTLTERYAGRKHLPVLRCLPACCPGLEELDYGVEAAPGGALARLLAALPRLTSLSLRDGVRLVPETAEAIGRLGALRKLRLDDAIVWDPYLDLLRGGHPGPDMASPEEVLVRLGAALRPRLEDLAVRSGGMEDADRLLEPLLRGLAGKGERAKGVALEPAPLRRLEICTRTATGLGRLPRRMQAHLGELLAAAPVERLVLHAPVMEGEDAVRAFRLAARAGRSLRTLCIGSLQGEESPEVCDAMADMLAACPRLRELTTPWCFGRGMYRDGFVYVDRLLARLLRVVLAGRGELELFETDTLTSEGPFRLPGHVHLRRVMPQSCAVWNELEAAREVHRAMPTRAAWAVVCAGLHAARERAVREGDLRRLRCVVGPQGCAGPTPLLPVGLLPARALREIGDFLPPAHVAPLLVS